MDQCETHIGVTIMDEPSIHTRRDRRVWDWIVVNGMPDVLSCIAVHALLYMHMSRAIPWS